MTQREAVLKYIQTHKKGITSIDAVNKLGCTRLSAVVSALKKKGYNIDSSRETVTSRYGTVSVSRYKMVD